MISRLKFEIGGLVTEMLDHLPEELWISDNTTFLDPSIGGGQFVSQIESRLQEYGHSDQNISQRVFGFGNNTLEVNYAINKNKLVADYKAGNFLEVEVSKKFDCIVGNPPFNESSNSSNTIAGTSGNTTLYRKFIDKAFEVREPKSGKVLMVTQRQGIRYTLDRYPVTGWSTDTSKFWSYSAGYFYTDGDKDTREDLTSDCILRKVYDIGSDRPFSHAIGGSFESLLQSGKISERQVPECTYGLLDTPKDGQECKYGFINGKAKPAGPKLVFKGLESKNSYMVTDLPHYVGSACTLYFETMEEAQKARMFILKSPIVAYLQKKLGEKTGGLVFRYIRSFDLSQIFNGNEIPIEFGLTKEEIDYIEATQK